MSKFVTYQDSNSSVAAAADLQARGPAYVMTVMDTLFFTGIHRCLGKTQKRLRHGDTRFHSDSNRV